MKPEYRYGLMNNYKDIFTLENEGNIETIWAAICSSSVNQQLWQAHVLSSQYPTKNESIQKWGGYRVLWDFYETFDKNDKRLEVLVGEFVGTDGKLYNKENPGTVLQTGAMPVKYGEDPAATGEESQIDWIVYRYADVITLLSEAIVRNSNAVTQEAVSLLIWYVRVLVFLPIISPISKVSMIFWKKYWKNVVMNYGLKVLAVQT